MTPPRRRTHRQVDHRYIAELCARHQSGDYVMAAERFCTHAKLSTLDTLRVKRLAQQQAAIDQALATAQKKR